MRFRIAAQLGIVLVLLGLLAAGTTGGFVYSISRDLLIRSAKEKLLTLTQDLSRRMVASRQEVIYLRWHIPPRQGANALKGLHSTSSLRWPLRTPRQSHARQPQQPSEHVRMSLPPQPQAGRMLHQYRNRVYLGW